MQTQEKSKLGERITKKQQQITECEAQIKKIKELII
jgi:hypothetical protein